MKKKTMFVVMSLSSFLILIMYVNNVNIHAEAIQDDENVESTAFAIVPENGTRISNHIVTFGWYYAKDAREYILQVDNNIDFSSPEIEVSTKNWFFTSNPLLDNMYYWRVKVNKGVNEAFWLWEGVAQFTVFSAFGIRVIIDLGVPHQQQHKDTRMLCLDNCAQIGKHAWDVDHVSRGPTACSHCDTYCVRASIAMINWYYGGSISQDRISYYLLGSGPPENDLGHGRGLYPSETNNGLSWALDGASIYNPGGKPSFDQIKTWIDANRPILRRNTAGDWHATVIDGYEENGDQLVHVIDPWTGTENIPAYADLPIYEVWVPPTVATARSDEATLTQDSDDDGIVDFDEINRFGTDPNKVDSDEDGVPDKSEIAYYTFTTRKPDPDGDGIRMELDPNEGPPDATIAAGSDNGYVYVYNKTGSLLWSYYTGADVASVAVSSDGAYIGVGSLGNKLYLFSRGGTKLWEQPVPIAYGGAGRGEESKSVAISAYGEYVVAGGTDKLYLYKKGGTLHWSHAGQETCVGISPNANYIVSCNKDDGTIDFFSSANSDPLWSKSIGAFWVATSDPGYVIASSSNKVYFFDNAGTEVWNYPLERGDLVRVDMPQDGLPAVTVNDDSGNMACYLWCFDLTGLDWKFTPCPPEHDFYSLAISADGNVISMGPGPMGGIYMFSRDGVSLQNITIGTFMDIHSVDLTSNGEFGACGDRDGKLWYFSKHSSTPLWSKTIGGNVHTVALATFGPPEAGGVGGVLVPIDKLGLLSPYIISTLAIVVTATVSAIYNKYKFKRRTRSNNLSNPPFI